MIKTKTMLHLFDIADAIGMPYQRARADILEIFRKEISSDNLLAAVIYGDASKANKLLNKSFKSLYKKLKPFDRLRKDRL
jgi:hypothetical protein